MKVKVWNDDTREYVEEYNGKMIRIPPKGFIVMERGDATGFMGKYKPIKINGQTGEHVQRKKLRREFIEEREDTRENNQEVKKHKCMIDGKEFNSEEELVKYVKDNHMDRLADKKTKDEFSKKVKKNRR